MSRYAKGKVIYVIGDLENYEHLHQIFIRLLKELLLKHFTFESDAPKSVEITLFHQEDKKRYIINLINFQKELPNIPVNDIKVCVKLDHRKVKKLLKLPSGKVLKYKIKKEYIEFNTGRLETFLMFALDYK